jgi:glycosyltransferase involved in cell wall biosynthesis
MEVMERSDALTLKAGDSCPVRLAILGSRGIPARYGGYETFAEQLGRRLVTRGVQVTVVCPTESPKPDAYYHGIRLAYVVQPNIGSFTQIFWDAKCFYLARRDFDIVYMLGVGASFAAWIPRVCGTQVWINTDGLEWKRSKWSLLQRVYLWLAEALGMAFASRIIADSSAIESSLRRRYPYRKQMTTIAYGAEIPAETPNPGHIKAWALEPGGYYIMVCRLEPENNVLEIIEGFRGSKSEAPLIVLGNTENPNRYVRSLLKASSPQVRFAGTTYHAEQLAALRFYARGYFHGHSVGGTNPSLLESMACGNLIIAHDNCFNREVLGGCGLFFRSAADVSAIVNAIESGQFNGAEAGRYAAERIRERYLWDQITDQYLELIRPSAVGSEPGAKLQ